MTHDACLTQFLTAGIALPIVVLGPERKDFFTQPIFWGLGFRAAVLLNADKDTPMIVGSVHHSCVNQLS